MDADKVNEAAEKAATIQYRNLSDPDVSQDGRTEDMFASMFEQGANWLMQQPLTDRLTDEEKERIKGLLNFIGENVNDSEIRDMQYEINSIIGAELFNEK